MRKFLLLLCLVGCNNVAVDAIDGSVVDCAIVDPLDASVVDVVSTIDAAVDAGPVDSGPSADAWCYLDENNVLHCTDAGM